MSKLNPFQTAVAVSVVNNMMATANTLYDAKQGIIVFDLSIGAGKASTKVEITNEDAGDVYDSLVNFDPDRQYSKSEIIARTIERVDPVVLATNPDGTPETIEKDGKMVETGREIPDPDNKPFVRFLTSTKKNTRYVVVPVAEWNDFTDAIGTLRDNADGVLDQARSQHEALEKAEKARAAKKAGDAIK